MPKPASRPINPNIMKKTILLSIALLAQLATAKAQTFDTVTGPNGRLPGYHYTEWFATCDAYFDTNHPPSHYPSWGQAGAINQNECLEPSSYWWVRPEHVDHPAAITGVGVWQTDTYLNPDYHPSPHYNNPRLPEYVNIFKPVGDTMLLFDSIRWDTATAKLYKIPYNIDTVTYGFKYCYLYEAHLKNPIYVDSLFYLAGTSNNNHIDDCGMYYSKPTCYSYLQVLDQFTCGDPRENISFWTRDSIFVICPDHNKTWGFFQPMIDYAMVHTLSADSTMGTAHPNCKLSKHVNQTIYATPASGYKFIWWNDGDTSNPRTVFVTQDTTFTAYFSDRGYFHVTAQPDYPIRGHVNGSGTYLEGDTVTLTAIPNNTYQFLHWNDGDTSNPRQFIITQDTSFTAHFDWPQTEGIAAPDNQAPLFTLSPNPAHNSVTITINSQLSTLKSQFSITMTDASGRDLLSLEVKSHIFSIPLGKYPSGTYLVTLNTPNGSATSKLIIE